MSEELDIKGGALGWQLTRLGWDYEEVLEMLPVNLARWFAYMGATENERNGAIELIFKTSGFPLQIRLQINEQKVPHSKKEILDFLLANWEELREHFKELKYHKLGQMVTINQHQ